MQSGYSGRLTFVPCALVLMMWSATEVGMAAPPPEPPPPASYRVVLRYRIAAPRDPHVVQYDAMIEHLQGLDMQFDPLLEQNPNSDREDRSKNYLKGKISSSKFLKLLGNPSVASVLLMPQDFDYPPKELDKVVRVRLELAGGFSPERQRELAEQVEAVLAALDFREAPGHDHHGYSGRPFTRLVGTIPAGRLEVLLKDLRGQPAGWLAPRISPPELPAPLRNVNPIQIIEVLADMEPISQVSVPPARNPQYLEKISPDLWALVEDKGHEHETVRVELIFVGMLTPQDQGWRQFLQQAAPGIFVEGQLGQVVNAVVGRGQVKTLATLSMISTVRLPRPAAIDVDPALALAGSSDKALSLAGLDVLHKKGYRGQKVRLAIIDTDFRGWKKLVKARQLPAATRLVDLTTERDPGVMPAPAADAPDELGHGTLCAQAAALAAPDAELYLVRIEGVAPYEIDEVARYLRGETMLSPYVDRRRDELVTARAELNLLRGQVLLERRVVLESFIDETDLQKDFGFLGPVFGWVFSPRTWIRDQVAYVDRLEQELSERNRRFFGLVEDIRALEGMTVVASPLVWNDGYALGAASPLSRAFDEHVPARAPTGRQPKAPLLWLQAAGNTQGQSWAGLFRDEDGNGLMEFAPSEYRLKKGQWTRELNFLAWQPFGKQQSADLPAGARLRISLQWREPHDPDYFLRPGEEDFYRRPLAELRLSLLRQRDPTFTKLPADAFEETAVTAGIPQRLEHQPNGSIYELVLETTLEKAGRYALRVERPRGFRWVLADEPGQPRPIFARVGGLKPSGVRPLGAVTLPLLEKHWELQSRLFVEVTGGERRAGRPVLADFATSQGTVAVPGDARSVITVGAADWNGQPEAASAGGTVAFAELARKPSLLAYDRLRLGTGAATGTSVATSFAAGMAATLISAGVSPETARDYLSRHNGRVLKIPSPSAQ